MRSAAFFLLGVTIKSVPNYVSYLIYRKEIYIVGPVELLMQVVWIMLSPPSLLLMSQPPGEFVPDVIAAVANGLLYMLVLKKVFTRKSRPSV